MSFNFSVSGCRLCHNSSLTRFKENKKFNLIRCNSCGIIYLDNFPDKQRIDNVYENDCFNYSAYYDCHRNDDLISFSSRLKLLEYYVPKKEGSTILDYGCSTGNFMEAAVNRGYLVEGIEPNKSSVAICEKKGLTVNEKIHQSYDLLHAGDVIEHVPEPLAFLNELHSCLKESGVLMLSTPDFDKWITRKTQIKPYEHLFYFTKKTLAYYLEQGGFQILYLKNCSRKRSISSLLHSSTSQDRKILLLLKTFNFFRLGWIINLLISNLNDDLLVIARKSGGTGSS